MSTSMANTRQQSSHYTAAVAPYALGRGPRGASLLTKATLVDIPQVLEGPSQELGGHAL
jgi:hypothetical protein